MDKLELNRWALDERLKGNTGKANKLTSIADKLKNTMIHDKIEIDRMEVLRREGISKWQA